MSTDVRTAPALAPLQRLLHGWRSADRALQYTLVAVACILLLGAAIVPASTTSKPEPPHPTAQLLAERYVAAVRKIDGVERVPSVASAARRYGTSGGSACRSSVAMLHASVRTGRTLDRVRLEQLRTRLRTYCPNVDQRYGTWLRARDLL